MSAIKFNVPYVSGNERKYIDEVFRNEFFSGNGPFTKRAQSWLENHLGAPKVLLTHSCTAGLEMAALINDISYGDEFLVPSFTFVTSASSIMRTGANPIFCEIDPITMSIDLDDAFKRLTNKTKAIVPVHYAGNSVDMEKLLTFANDNDLIVIEDAAQALGSSWKGKPLGTFAPLSAISFHETKNIHSGLGGCLIINDESQIELAEIIWERGTNRSAFFKGFVDKYSWQEIGSSFYPSELQAAFLLAQLESLEENLLVRSQIWENYQSMLSNMESDGCFEILKPPKENSQNFHMFAIKFPSEVAADSARVQLNRRGIQAVIHYVPLHTSKMGLNLGYSEGDLPITESSSSRLLRLPMHHEITADDIMQIESHLSEICRD